MKKLFLELSIAALCAALLSACGESSDDATNMLTYTETEEGIVAETKEDLPNCSKNREGVRATLDEGNFVCTSGRWTAEDPVYESEEDLPRCTEKREGVKAKTEDGNFVCLDGEWAKEIPGYDTEEDLPRCTKRKEGTVVFIEETEATMVCEDGKWINASEDSDGSSSSDETDEGKSSASEELDSSGSEGVEGSSASVPGGSSDSSVYDAMANTLTDLRDGQTYKTVKIGDQVWMAENLNLETDNSWCYGDESENCDSYGRLYKWAAAVGKSEDECGYGYECDLGTGDIRGVCPKGWHLPSQAEWNALLTAVGGSSTAGIVLKSSTGWSGSGNGFDDYSFTALAVGFRVAYGMESAYDYEGLLAYFWSSTESDGVLAYHMGLSHATDEAWVGENDKYKAFSVRCLKD